MVVGIILYEYNGIGVLIKVVLIVVYSFFFFKWWLRKLVGKYIFNRLVMNKFSIN